MNKITAIITTILLLSCSDQKVIQEYWENGNLKFTGNSISGSKEGKWTYLRENGDTSRVEYFKTGTLFQKDVYGYYHDWPELGDTVITTTLLERHELRDSIKNGSFTTFYPNGMVNCKGEYVNGLRSDTVRCWYETGEMSTLTYYKNGEPMQFIQYWPNGTTMMKSDKRGEGIHHFYDSTGFLEHKLLISTINRTIDTLETYVR